MGGEYRSELLYDWHRVSNRLTVESSGRSVGEVWEPDGRD